MNECPCCREPMVALELEGLEIDRCFSCGGTWLDRGEMELIGQRAGLEEGRVTQVLDGASQGTPTDRRCPRCGKALLELALDCGEEKLTLDRCPRRHGIWFDRGEIRELILSCSTGEEGALAGFLSELLDKEIKGDKE